MKKLICINLFSCMVLFAHAQSPNKFTYQAVVRDAAGSLVKNVIVGVRLSIIQGTVSGTIAYSETQTPTTNANGLFTLAVGEGTARSGALDTVNWAGGPYYLKTEVDATGGTNYNIISTSQLLSVPYAIHSSSTESIDWVNVKNRPETINGSNVGEMQYWDGTKWALIPTGKAGQYLQLNTLNIPTWSGSTFPVVSTTVANITFNTAIIGGDITIDSGSTVVSRGVCYNTSPNPTINNNAVYVGSGTGSYSTTLSNLITNTNYYVKAFATNAAGTTYGNEISFTTQLSSSLTIGQSYQGGIIFKIDSSGFHGLIASPLDSDAHSWAPNIIDDLTIENGKTNTLLLMQSFGTLSAAAVCGNLHLNGFSDWYLPSLNELRLMYVQKDVIGSFQTAPNARYWSSTPSYLVEFYIVPPKLAASISFADGYIHEDNIDISYRIRPIRSF